MKLWIKTLALTSSCALTALLALSPNEVQAAAPSKSAGKTTGKPSDMAARVKVARELALLAMSKESFQASLANTSAAMLRSMDPQGTLPPETAKKIALAVEEALPFDEMIGWSAEVYAARFSIDELKGLIAFYKTPLGQKLSKALPEIMGEVGAKVGSVMPERLPAAMKKQGLTP